MNPKKEDAFYDIMDLETEIHTHVLNEYLERKPGDRMRWRLISFPRLKRIWETQAFKGIVRDDRGLDTIIEICIENFHKIQLNNLICGHTPEDPVDALNDRDYVEDKVWTESDFEDYYYYEWCEDENGCARISDYSNNKLLEACIKMEAATDDMGKICAVDEFLQVAHMRSDLASWFVEGGSDALSELSGYLREQVA
jgi:hypothetical protein